MRPSRQRPTSLTHGIKPTPRSRLNTRKSTPTPYTTSSLPSLRVTQLQTLFRMNRLTLQDLPDGVKKDIPESVWDAVTYDGKISGVPTIAQVYTLFANTDALTAAGISLPTRDKPWTWDDLATNATKL